MTLKMSKSNLIVAHQLEKKWRSDDIRLTEDADFSSLCLSKPILQGLKNAGFMKPSPIQLRAIPLGKVGLDLIVQAKSGTGKTCVFTVIALQSLILKTKSPQILIIAPTREIAFQICDVIKKIGSEFKDLSCQTFIGGLPLESDKRKLVSCHIAVGTPGRLKQLIEKKYLKSHSIRLLVLDEADKLMLSNIREDIDWIYSQLPSNKQVVTCSATYPEDLANWLQQYMRNPMCVRLDVDKPALLGLMQYYEKIPFHPQPHIIHHLKEKFLFKLLESVTFSQCLIFFNYQNQAGVLWDKLKTQGWPVEFICGNQDQMHRLKVMNQLKTFQCRILITTDLTSRGIDAENVDLVINYEPTWDTETYLHRIGRAGRFGSYGISITLASEGKELDKLLSIRSQAHLDIYKFPTTYTNLWQHMPDQSDLLEYSTFLESSHQEVIVQEIKDLNVYDNVDQNLPTSSLCEKENLEISDGFSNKCIHYTTSNQENFSDDLKINSTNNNENDFKSTSLIAENVIENNELTKNILEKSKPSCEYIEDVLEKNGPSDDIAKNVLKNNMQSQEYAEDILEMTPCNEYTENLIDKSLASHENAKNVPETSIPTNEYIENAIKKNKPSHEDSENVLKDEYAEDSLVANIPTINFSENAPEKNTSSNNPLKIISENASFNEFHETIPQGISYEELGKYSLNGSLSKCDKNISESSSNSIDKVVIESPTFIKIDKVLDEMSSTEINKIVQENSSHYDKNPVSNTQSDAYARDIAEIISFDEPKKDILNNTVDNDKAVSENISVNKCDRNMLINEYDKIISKQLPNNKVENNISEKVSINEYESSIPDKTSDNKHNECLQENETVNIQDETISESIPEKTLSNKCEKYPENEHIIISENILPCKEYVENTSITPGESYNTQSANFSVLGIRETLPNKELASSRKEPDNEEETFESTKLDLSFLEKYKKSTCVKNSTYSQLAKDLKNYLSQPKENFSNSPILSEPSFSQNHFDIMAECLRQNHDKFKSMFNAFSNEYANMPVKEQNETPIDNEAEKHIDEPALELHDNNKSNYIDDEKKNNYTSSLEDSEAKSKQESVFSKNAILSDASKSASIKLSNNSMKVCKYSSEELRSYNQVRSYLYNQDKIIHLPRTKLKFNKEFIKLGMSKLSSSSESLSSNKSRLSIKNHNFEGTSTLRQETNFSKQEQRSQGIHNYDPSNFPDITASISSKQTLMPANNVIENELDKEEDVSSDDDTTLESETSNDEADKINAHIKHDGTVSKRKYHSKHSLPSPPQTYEHLMPHHSRSSQEQSRFKSPKCCAHSCNNHHHSSPFAMFQGHAPSCFPQNHFCYPNMQAFFPPPPSFASHFPHPSGCNPTDRWQSCNYASTSHKYSCSCKPKPSIPSFTRYCQLFNQYQQHFSSMMQWYKAYQASSCHYHQSY